MISGFTIVRHGESFDYPYLESLRSLLPVVDELVINVGVGTDSTKAMLEKFSKEEGQGKIILFDSTWPLDDPEKRKSGKILSEQTNLALDRCRGDWCIYLQADEVLHENSAPILQNAFEELKDYPLVNALVFPYLHFYGSYDLIRKTRGAYRREVRAIRKSSGLRSIGDAQSFRKPSGEKPLAALAPCEIFHYGWVRTPEQMKQKTQFMDTLYHGAGGAQATADAYRYKVVWGLEKFTGSHPQFMKERIATKNWNWDVTNSPKEYGWRQWKTILLDSIEKFFGMRFFEYRSYRIIRYLSDL